MPDYAELVHSIIGPWAQAHDLTFEPAQYAQWAQYLALLMRYKDKVNLVGTHEPERMIRELFVDSLEILTLGPPRGPLIDVGSGAGFPGIPLKIARPEIEVHLVEPLNRRSAFLRLVQRELKLDALVVQRCRMEGLKPMPVGFAISKAFRAVDQWLTLCEPWLAQNADIACLVSAADWQTLALPWLAKHTQYEVKAQKEVGTRIYAIVHRA